MLQIIAEVDLPHCRFELMEGQWPKPVEMPWQVDQPVLSQMFLSADYRMEGRPLGEGARGFSPLGRTILSLPGQEMIGRGSGGPVRLARCCYDLDRFQELVGRDLSLSEAERARALDVGNPIMNMLMRLLIREVERPQFVSRPLMESITTTLLIESARNVFGDPPGSGDGGKLTDRHLRRIEEYLESVEIGTPSIADVAAACGLSAHYFAKLFRNATGQSLGRYIADWRRRRAERLLAETDLPLKEIAYRLGFSNAGNFSQAFRNEVHMTPGAFRKQQQGHLWQGTRH